MRLCLPRLFLVKKIVPKLGDGERSLFTIAAKVKRGGFCMFGKNLPRRWKLVRGTVLSREQDTCTTTGSFTSVSIVFKKYYIFVSHSA
jgi:hypothetical protein